MRAVSAHQLTWGLRGEGSKCQNVHETHTWHAFHSFFSNNSSIYNACPCKWLSNAIYCEQNGRFHSELHWCQVVTSFTSVDLVKSNHRAKNTNGHPLMHQTMGSSRSYVALNKIACMTRWEGSKCPKVPQYEPYYEKRKWDCVFQKRATRSKQKLTFNAFYLKQNGHFLAEMYIHETQLAKVGYSVSAARAETPQTNVPHSNWLTKIHFPTPCAA